LRPGCQDNSFIVTLKNNTLNLDFYRQEARSATCIVLFHGPIFGFVAPQGRRFRSAIAKGRYRKGPLSQKSAGHTQNSKTKTNTNPSPDPNRYRRRCPDPNARIQKCIHYMAIATFAIAALCDSGLSPGRHVLPIKVKFGREAANRRTVSPCQISP